jgi:hypothetical protein
VCVLVEKSDPFRVPVRLALDTHDMTANHGRERGNRIHPLRR